MPATVSFHVSSLTCFPLLFESETETLTLSFFLSSSSSSSSSSSVSSFKQQQVIENRAESADGSARTLLLSVEEAVSRQASSRWLDNYRAPGQQVAVRVPKSSSSSSLSFSSPSPPPSLQGGESDDFRELSRLFSLSSSPYEARRESSRLDASIIEILVDRSRGGADDELLGSLAPGALLHVSQVIGSGFAPLFSLGLGSGGSSGNDDGDGYSLSAKARDRGMSGGARGGRGSDVAAAAAAAGSGDPELGAELAEALEEARPLLLVAGPGAAGAGALRATLEWAPVAAAASASSAAAGRNSASEGAGDDPASGIAAAAAEAAAAASSDSDLGGRGAGRGRRRRAPAGRVVAVLLAPDAASAPYLKEWDLWRDAGVTVVPVYVGEKSDDDPSDTTALEAALFSAVFGGPGGLRGLLSGGGGGSSSGSASGSPSSSPSSSSSSSSSSVDPSEAAVLVAGLPRPVAVALVRRLCSIEGVSSERVMFGSPYF